MDDSQPTKPFETSCEDVSAEQTTTVEDPLAVEPGPSSHRQSSMEEDLPEERERHNRIMARAMPMLRAKFREQKEGYYGTDYLSSYWEEVDQDALNVGLRDARGLIAPLPPDSGHCDINLFDTLTLTRLPDEADALLQAYSYETSSPLKTTTSIRLLEIISPPMVNENGHESLAVCKLHVVDLMDNPKYSALSYTWGIPQLMHQTADKKPDVQNAYENCYPIICDDRILMVAKNLHDALEIIQDDATRDYLKSASSEEPPQLIWIDAVCINQADDTEKGAQVEMMGDIYKQAELVLIWLGPQNWYSVQALQCCKVVVEMMRKYPGMDLPSVDIYNKDWWQAQGIDELLLPEGKCPHWEALYLYLQHTWFRRSWVVQELSFAKLAYMFNGATSMRWAYFAGCCQWLVDQGWHIQLEESGRWLVQGIVHSDLTQRVIGPSRQEVLRHMPPKMRRMLYTFLHGKQLELPLPAIIAASTTREFCQHGRKFGSATHPNFLREVLERFRSFDASNGSDKVYAFLSICEDAMDVSRPASERPIRVEYKKPIHEIFTEATTYILDSCPSVTELSQQTSRNTELLWQVEDRADSHVLGLPSWVPNFSVPCTPAPFEDLLAKEWNCWPLDFRLRDPPRAIGNYLSCVAVMIDEIVEVAGPSGDLLQNSATAIHNLPRTYLDQEETADRSALGITETGVPVRELADELLSEAFLAEVNREKSVADTAAAKGEPVGQNEQETDARLDKLKRETRGKLMVIPSPRRQTRNEALWRTLVLDYSDEDPAPLSLGFTLGDWIARRIEEAFLPAMFKQTDTLRHNLEAELRTWRMLEAAEPDGDVAGVCWPAERPDDIAKLKVYAQEDWFASYFTAFCESYRRAGMPLGEDKIQQMILWRSMAAGAAPIRLIPTWDQLKAYLLRPGDSNFSKTRGNRQANFFKQYNKYNPGRRVFCTAGGLIGNGHRSARPGDQVWLLPHCTVPFILRPVDNAGGAGAEAGAEGVFMKWGNIEDEEHEGQRFKMIGACYVHGLMHREGHFDPDNPSVLRRIVIE